jgi:hypothetical protein
MRPPAPPNGTFVLISRLRCGVSNESTSDNVALSLEIVMIAIPVREIPQEIREITAVFERQRVISETLPSNTLILGEFDERAKLSPSTPKFDEPVV